MNVLVLRQFLQEALLSASPALWLGEEVCPLQHFLNLSLPLEDRGELRNVKS